MRSAADVRARTDALFEASLDAGGSMPVILTGSDTISWSTFAHAVHSCEAALMALNVAAGTQVGVVAHSSPAVTVVLTALLRLGATFVSISPLQSVGAIKADIERLALPILVLSEDDDPALDARGLCAQTGLDAALLTHSDLKAPTVFGGPLTTAPGRADVAILMQSSGTTGTPKRIPLRYDAFLFPISRQLALETDGTVFKQTPLIVASPIAHIGGLFFTIKAVLDARPQILMRRFDVGQWVNWVSQYQLKLGHLVPATIKALYDANIPEDKLHSLKAIISGAAALAPELQADFEARYAIPILVVYGATEFAGGIAGWSLDLHRDYRAKKIGSVGRALPGTRLRVVEGATGMDVGVNAQGLLEVQSRQGAGDDWVRTTDLAVIDEDGFLWIKGRADAAINRGGFKILPSDVEAVVLRHRDVADAAVVGVPDDRLGAVPACAVVAKPGTRLTQEGLRAHCRESLARYQVPRDYLFVEALPMTVSNKPSLPAIKALFVDNKTRAAS